MRSQRSTLLPSTDTVPGRRTQFLADNNGRPAAVRRSIGPRFSRRDPPVPETERDPDAAPPSAGQPPTPAACRVRLRSAASAFAFRLRLIPASVARICRSPHLRPWLHMATTMAMAMATTTMATAPPLPAPPQPALSAPARHSPASRGPVTSMYR